MQTIITQPCPDPHANPAAQPRADRLARATANQMETALAFLAMIDPEAFDIAFTAVAPSVGDHPEDQEPVPLCRACGGPVGIFPEHGLAWQHYRSNGITSGVQETYDPGHTPEAAWYLPDEAPDEI
jgi:hypothetical protein